MIQYDSPELTFKVLANLLLECPKKTSGKIEHLLGEIVNLSRVKELRILKQLHENDVIFFHKYHRSDGKSYPITDDFSRIERNVVPRDFLNFERPSVSVTTPTIAILELETEKLEKEIERLELVKNKIGNRVLEKDEQGNFFFNGKMLTTRNKPLDHNVKHYKILDILLDKSDQHNQVSVDVMIRELKRRNEWVHETDEKIIKNINNAINNGLFDKVTVGSKKFENLLPNKKDPVIQGYKNNGRIEGWKLNNPEK
ncbi:MAG: hypothetical protein K9M36_02575 [Candidatus Pacebacteria bacterium]|nr:hypothetical protein [Candidatus Paceibacterota bacterium]